MIYAGMCIGGPRAGQWLSMEHSTMECYEAPALPPAPYSSLVSGRGLAEQVTVRKHVYIWRPLNLPGIPQPDDRVGGVFLHESIKGDADMWRELFNGYHPYVNIRDV